MSNIDKYTNFISEQVHKGSVVGLRTGVIAEASDVEAHGDPDTAGSYKSINKIHAHIKAAGHTIHHDDDGKATKSPHVTAHYEMGEDRDSSHPSGFTVHPKAQGDKKLMSLVKSHNDKYDS